MDVPDLGTILGGGGVATAVTTIFVALLKSRSGTRETVIKTQQDHMARLTQERNDAVKERDTAYEDADGWREKYEHELTARIEASAEAHASRLMVKSLEGEVARLTTQVAQNTTEMVRLRADVRALPPGGTGE